MNRTIDCDSGRLSERALHLELVDYLHMAAFILLTAMCNTCCVTQLPGAYFLSNSSVKRQKRLTLVLDLINTSIPSELTLVLDLINTSIPSEPPEESSRWFCSKEHPKLEDPVHGKEVMGMAEQNPIPIIHSFVQVPFCICKECSGVTELPLG